MLAEILGADENLLTSHNDIGNDRLRIWEYIAQHTLGICQLGYYE